MSEHAKAAAVISSNYPLAPLTLTTACVQGSGARNVGRRGSSAGCIALVSDATIECCTLQLPAPAVADIC